MSCGILFSSGIQVWPGGAFQVSLYRWVYVGRKGVRPGDAAEPRAYLDYGPEVNFEPLLEASSIAQDAFPALL